MSTTEQAVTNGVKELEVKAPSRMTLAAVHRGKIDLPVRVVAYGPEGIGKSTLASNAPSPIFIGAENGTAQLDVARFPEPRSWGDLLEAIHVLSSEKHDYKTVVLDTLDWAEPLCWEAVCFAGHKAQIEDFGYGKGYVAAVDNWRVLTNRLDALRATKGMHVILLAHSKVSNFKNPEGDDYDRFTLKLHEKSAGLLKEWCDAVLFCNYETFVTDKGDKGSRKLGVSSGARVVHTQRRASFDAKNRYSLPETLALDWNEFYEATRAAQVEEPSVTRIRIDRMLVELGDAKVEKRVRDFVKQVGDDAVKLAEAANKIAARLGKKQQEAT